MLWTKRILDDDEDGFVTTVIEQMTESEFDTRQDCNWRHPDQSDGLMYLTEDEIKPILADHQVLILQHRQQET
jgi:hypothetical protein